MGNGSLGGEGEKMKFLIGLLVGAAAAALAVAVPARSKEQLQFPPGTRVAFTAKSECVIAWKTDPASPVPRPKPGEPPPAAVFPPYNKKTVTLYVTPGIPDRADECPIRFSLRRF